MTSWLEESQQNNFVRKEIIGVKLEKKSQCRAIIIRSILSKIITKDQKTHHGPPIRVRYGVSFVDPICLLWIQLYSAPVTVVKYAISCYIGPCYNDTQLYIFQ